MAVVNTLPGSNSHEIGEGPHWIEEDQALVFVDIIAGNFHRYFTETERWQTMKPVDIGKGNTTSIIVPIEGVEDEFIITIGKTIAWIKWLKSDPDICSNIPVHINTFDDNLCTRFNDGKCDPAGRLWAGTMNSESIAESEQRQSSLYRLDSALVPSRHLTEVGTSNGLAWTADRKKFYYIDSKANSLDVFDYDHSNGEISNRRSVFNYKNSGPDENWTGTEGVLDGMCIDTDGNLWVACFRGAKVICINPLKGTVIRKIDIPSLKTTSCCWGGKDYSTLFVTSANRLLTEDELIKRPDNGKTFSITGLGVKGLPPISFKIDPKQLEALRNNVKSD